MLQIPIQSLPNQSLSINLDSNQYDISIKLCKNIMALDIVRNNVVIVTGQRSVFGYGVIPYEYLEDGNFAFITNDNEYPDYLKFGISQFLVYASQDELEAFRAGA